VQEDGLPFVPAGDATADGTAAGSAVCARLIQDPYIPGPGVNDRPRKDLLFYADPASPDTLRMAVQNPDDPSEWTVYTAPGYGDWFRKELDLYIRLSRGL